jgi:ParB-like chromosome segregation protein Spo0J
MKLPVRLLRSEWPPNDGLRPGNERFDSMLASVRDEGIREPLTINLQWLVIDGNHRLNAARFLGMETVEVRVWTGTEYVE